MRRQLFTACALFVTLAGMAPAAVRFVKPGGTGDGSSVALASGSIAAMCLAAGAGDTIKVATGTYTELVTPVILVDNVRLHGGYDAATFTTSSPLTAASVIDGQRTRSGLRIGQTAVPAAAPNGFDIAGFHFIRCWAVGALADNLDRGGAIGVHWTTAATLNGTISQCQFENCLAQNGGAALWTGASTGTEPGLGGPATHYITLQDSTITSCTSPANATGGTGTSNGTGQQSVAAIWTQRGGGRPRTILRRNVIKDCIAPNNAVVFTNVNSTNECEISNNLIYNCHNTKPATDPDVATLSHGGVLFFGGRNNSFFANNTIANCSAPSYFISHDTNNGAGAHQTITIMFANNIFANNTLNGHRSGGNAATVPTFIIQRSNNNVATAPNCIFKKNLFFNNRMADNSAITNLFGSLNGTDLMPLVAADNFVNIDPLFVSASNFHVQTGSPAIDAGIASAVTLDATPQTISVPTFDLEGLVRPKGAGFDLGAYEVQPPNRIDGWNIY